MKRTCLLARTPLRSRHAPPLGAVWREDDAGGDLSRLPPVCLDGVSQPIRPTAAPAATALQQRGASEQYDRRLDKDNPFPRAVSDGPIGAFADMFAPNVDDVFAEDKPLIDADLVNLRGLKHLDRLVLSGTKITDTGLEHLRHVPQLPNLRLSRTAITDAGLVHLKAVPRLEVLLLDGTQIANEGLVHVGALRHLRVLDLSGTPIGDAGLDHLQGLKQLKVMRLNKTRITDAGLAHLRPLERLEDLDLTDTNITGEGFARLGNLPRLTRLYLNNTRLNDTGMAHLRKFASLVVLNTENTPASDRAVDSLRQALPDLSIDGVSHRDLHEESKIWQDWGVRDVAAPNYLLANWIRLGYSKPSTTLLSPRLAAALKNDTRDVVDVHHLHMTDALRQQLSRLRRVQWLRLSAETTGEDLSWIGKLPQLRGVSLRGANLAGGDFRNLADVQTLQWLDLAYAEMTADQFAAFPRAPVCKRFSWRARASLTTTFSTWPDSACRFWLRCRLTPPRRRTPESRRYAAATIWNVSTFTARL